MQVCVYVWFVSLLQIKKQDKEAVTPPSKVTGIHSTTMEKALQNFFFFFYYSFLVPIFPMEINSSPHPAMLIKSSLSFGFGLHPENFKERMCLLVHMFILSFHI